MIRIFLCLVLCALAGSAQAQGTHKLTVNFGLGPAFPVNPERFTDLWNSGPTIGTGISYALTPVLAAMVILDFGMFTLNENKALIEVGAPIGNVAGGRITIRSGTLNLKACVLPHATGIRPYLLGGGGIYRLSVGDVAWRFGDIVQPNVPFDLPESETTQMLQVGLGMDIPAGRNVELFVEGRFVIAFTEGDSRTTIPIRLGIKSR